MSKKLILFTSVLALLFISWELAASASSSLLFILPPPSEIFSTLWEMRDRFYFHTLVTLKEMCGGFLLALLAAFPLAWTMMRFKTSRSLLQPLFIVIQCLPMFTLAPIMVIWFGWGFTAIVIPTALMIFFPLTLNIYQGLRSTPKDLLEFFHVNQATSWQTFAKLRLPWAVPHIFAGFRISSAIAGVGAVAGEWAGAQNGLGILMLESRRNTELEVTFAALICLTLISTSLYGLILYCEKVALPPRKWKVPIAQFLPEPFRLPKKRFALPFFLFAFLLLALFGCQKQSTQTRLLLDWLPNPNHVPLYVGLRKGYFAEEGIELSIQKMHDNGGGISYLVSNQADLLVSHMPGTLKACSRGAQLKIAGLLIKEPLCGLIYHADHDVGAPSDLSGLTLGYCIGEHDTTFLNYLLDRSQIVPSTKKNVSVDLVSAMGTRSVDFIWGAFWNIEPAQLQALGVETKTFKTQELQIPSYYEMVILANTHFPEEKAHAFARALQKSIDFCKAYPERSFEIYLLDNQDKREKTRAWERAAWEMTCPLLADNQMTDLELVADFYAWQREQGIVDTSFDVSSLVYTHEDVIQSSEGGVCEKLDSRFIHSGRS